MRWTDWTTLAIAVLGAGLGVFNSITGYLRAKPKLTAKCVLENLNDGTKRIVIDLVNSGHVPVTVTMVQLASSNRDHPKVAFLRQEPSHLWNPKELGLGAHMRLIGRREAKALDFPFMQNVYGIAVDIGGGRTLILKSSQLVAHAKQLRSASPAQQSG